MAPDSWEFQSLSADAQEPEPAAKITLTQRQPLPRQPPRLKYAAHEASFRFRESVREAYEAVGDEFGVRVIFDEDFDADAGTRADLAECGFPCAMRILGELSRSIAVPLSDDMVLIAQDDGGTRGEYETSAFATIPLGGPVAAEDAAEITQVIQQVLDMRRVQSSAGSGAIFLRDTVGKVDMAKLLAQDLLHSAAAVVIELQMISVSSGGLVRAGIDLPSSFPVTNFGTLFGAMPDVTGTERLVGIGGGKTALGVALGDASALARFERSAAQTLQQMQIRSLHGMAAEFKIGERYPIATAQYSSGGPVPQDPGYTQPPPSIAFEDLGLVLSATPLVHSATEVTLDLDVKFRLLAGGAVNDVPILANREFQSQVRLRQGEFAIVSGMAVYDRSKSNGGLAGLGNIPLLGALFRRNEWRWNRRDLLALIMPRVVRLPPGELARSTTILFGAEERPLPAL